MKMKKNTLFNPFLVGKNVYLRRHIEEDLDCWYRWFNDQGVTLFMQHGYFPNTYENQKSFLKSMYKAKNNLQLAIVAKNKDVLIRTMGLHGIHPVNKTADISIVIGDKKYWGKACAKESLELMLTHAFQKMNLHKLTAGMAVENVASYKLFISFGFKKRGC